MRLGLYIYMYIFLKRFKIDTDYFYINARFREIEKSMIAGDAILTPTPPSRGL